MKGVIKKTFKQNQFHYTDESDFKQHYVLEPFVDIVGLADDEAGYFVDSEKGLIEGELYIVSGQKSAKWKSESKENFFKNYPQIKKIVKIEKELSL